MVLDLRLSFKGLLVRVVPFLLYMSILYLFTPFSPYECFCFHEEKRTIHYWLFFELFP